VPSSVPWPCFLTACQGRLTAAAEQATFPSYRPAVARVSCAMVLQVKLTKKVVRTPTCTLALVINTLPLPSLGNRSSVLKRTGEIRTRGQTCTNSLGPPFSVFREGPAAVIAFYWSQEGPQEGVYNFRPQVRPQSAEQGLQARNLGAHVQDTEQDSSAGSPELPGSWLTLGCGRGADRRVKREWTGSIPTAPVSASRGGSRTQSHLCL
jgi:hypothetical protein